MLFIYDTTCGQFIETRIFLLFVLNAYEILFSKTWEQNWISDICNMPLYQGFCCYVI